MENMVADKDAYKRKKMIALLQVLTVLLVFVSCAPAFAQTPGFDDPASRGKAGGTGGGDIIAVEPEVKAGNISIGSTAQVVVLFRNDSGRPVTTGAIQLYPSSTVSANVSLNQCSQEDLPAGAVCAVAVSVKGLQPGAWRVDMLMRHSGRARLVTASLSGNIDAGEGASARFVSDIEAIPDVLDFGDLTTSQPIIKGVVLRNVTSEPVDVNAVYIEAADRAGYSLRTDCAHMEAGQACIVIITWSPVLKGQATGVLLIDHTGPTKIASVDLDGKFDPEDTKEAQTFPEAVPGKGLLVASQSDVDFGSGIETTSAITVSLVNVGDAPLTIKDLRLASGDSGLSIAKKGCVPDLVLEPVEACPLTLSWSPVREGNVIDDVQVVHDGARGILVLPVRGGATALISQDSKAVRLAGAETASLAPGDAPEGEVFIQRDDSIDPVSVLDGFVVTSHSPKRGIISGPGGSRIVFDGEEVVIGGFLWKINIRASGVEFRSGDEKVLLLFDRSLSSVNRTSSQSGSGGGTSAATPTSGAAAATTTGK